MAVRDMRLTLISLLGLGLAPAVLCCAPPPLQARRRVALPSGAQPLRKSSSSSSTQKRRGGRNRGFMTQAVSQERRMLWDEYTDPVPMLVGAAVVAAAGPALYTSLKRVPSQLASMLRMRPRFFGKGTARPKLSEVWDGTLEDGRVLRAARDALDTWRQTDGRPLEVVDPGLRVAALGASILDFSSTDSSPRFDSAARLFEMRSYLEVAARADGGDMTAARERMATTALRQATTALSRRGLGGSRSGSLLATAAREEHAAALLVAGEAVGAPAAAREQILLAFGLIGQDEKAERLRVSAAQRVFRMEARRILKASAPTGNEAAALQCSDSARRLATEVLGLGAQRSFVVSVLLTEVRETTRAAMEEALELWVAAGGASTPFTEHGAAHALATRATRLTRACLSYAGDGDDSSRRTESGMARSLGLTSIARHGFYGSFVAAAVKNEVAHAAPSGGAEQRLSSLAEERTPSSISSGAATNFIFGVDDAAILRELLGVLPVSADASDLAAFQSAASWGVQVVGVDREVLEGIGARLGIDPQKIEAVFGGR